MSKHKNYSAPTVTEEEAVVVEETPVPIPVEEEIAEQVTLDEFKTITGTVVGCLKLNVREQMFTGATILCELPASSEVQIFADENHDEWYHVITASGIDGYCMKKYIAINS